MKKYAFGIDIGGTTIKTGLFKTSGELLERWEIITFADFGLQRAQNCRFKPGKTKVVPI